MNTFSNISGELKAFFSNNPIFKILLPIDLVFLFGGLILTFINSVLGIGLGGLVTSIAYWAVILGLLLAFSNFHLQYLYIGLLGYGAMDLIILILNIFKGWGLGWGYLLSAAVYGGLGYLVFKYAVSGKSQSTGYNS